MTNTQSTKNQTDTTQAIKDRVARYKSGRMTKGQHDSMSSDIGDAVAAAGPTNVDQSVAWMTVVTGFIADVAPRDGGSLGDYLNDATISRWVTDGVNSGKSRRTLNTRRGILNRVLRAYRGVASSTSHGPARRPTAGPLSANDVARLAEGCKKSCRSAWRGYVAHVTAGVPVGTRGARFETGAVNLVTTDSQSWLVAHEEDALLTVANLAGDYLITDDWEALKDVADALGITLTCNSATQTFRFLALNDDRFSIAERLTNYQLNDRATTSLAHFLRHYARVLTQVELLQLRNGSLSGDCTRRGPSTLSGRAASRISTEVEKPLTRKTSRAAAKRLAAQRSAAIATKQLHSQPVADYLATYVPDCDDAVWDSIAETVRSAVACCQFASIETARKHAVALTAFFRWRVQQGLPSDVASSLTFATIDAFYAHGMPDLSHRSRGDYRSRLRRLASTCNASVKAPPSLELGHNKVNPGYNLTEERELRRWAQKQSQPEVRRRLCAIVGLCAGAGLSSSELRELRREDIRIDADGTIVVWIGGERPRWTVVRRNYEELVTITLVGLTPDQLVLPALKASSPITAILKGSDDLGCTVALDTRRLRTTWICWLMSQHVSLQLAFEASGLQSARTFHDMLVHLPVLTSLGELRDGGAK